jgi:hypothetical protein
VDQVEKGNLLYVNTKKASAWNTLSGKVLPIRQTFPRGQASRGSLAVSVRTEADLVKTRIEHPGYYQQDQRQGLDNSYFAAVEAGETKKSANWARGCGLQLPIVPLPAEALSNQNIPTEEGPVNLSGIDRRAVARRE